MSVWGRILHLPSDSRPLLEHGGLSNYNNAGRLDDSSTDAKAEHAAASDLSISSMNYGALWSEPLGGPARSNNDEHLLMFRRAVGIHSDASSAGQAQDTSTATGIYRTVVRRQQRMQLLHHTVSGLVWGCHGVQIVVGATLTCLGLREDDFHTNITVLGAVNTAIAGVLTLIKGKGLPEKLGRSEADFRQLRVWIEETESLLALGVIGRDRKEVGLLVETAFRRYNACFGQTYEIEADMDRDSDDADFGDEEESGIIEGGRNC